MREIKKEKEKLKIDFNKHNLFLQINSFNKHR